MLHLLQRIFLVVLVLATPQWARADTTSTAGVKAENYIFLIDTSESTQQFNEPHTMESMITQALMVAGLSQRPVKVAVIFYGERVHVIAGSDGMPTAAHQTILLRALKEWPAPKGLTPLDTALLAAANMVKSARPGDSVTIVNFGDGSPTSGRLRPDDFPAVREQMERRIQAIHNSPYPPEIQQEQIANLHRLWRDPESDEGKVIWSIQHQAQFDACLSHAAALKARRVRFVTFDFHGLEALNQIHESAGGTVDDYALVRPANTILAKLHDLGLMNFDGVLVLPPMRVEARDDAFEASVPLDLGTVGDQALITVSFDTPIEDFPQHIDLSFASGGHSFRFEEGNLGPDMLLSHDAAGRTATATLSLADMPPDGRIVLNYRSPRQSLRAPAMTIYAHIRLGENLQAIFRPVHVDVDAKPPFQLSPQQLVQWTASLRQADEPRPVDLTNVEAVLRRQVDGREIRIDMSEDPAAPDRYVSADRNAIERGLYDVELHFGFPSGLNLKLRLAGHIDCQAADEHVTLELDDSSASPNWIDIGEIGDERTEGTIHLQVRSANVAYPITLDAAVVELTDSSGNAPGEPITDVSPTRFTVRPGKPTKVMLRWKLPERMDGVLDGPWEGRLTLTREDLDEPVDVRPFEEGSPAAEPINTVRFFLRRPEIVLSCPRGWRDELSDDAEGESSSLSIHADLGLPLERSIRLRAGHTSRVDRQLQLALELPFRDVQGRSYPEVELASVEECPLQQPVAVGTEAQWDLGLLIPMGLDANQLEGFIVISGDGMLPRRVPITLHLRHPPWGNAVQAGFWVLAAALALGAMMALRRLFRMRCFRLGHYFEITPEKPFEFLSVLQSRKGETELVIGERDVVIGKVGQSRLVAAPRRISLAEMLRPGEELLIGKKATPESAGLTVAVGPPQIVDGEPVVPARIYDSGQHAPSLEKTPRQLRRRLFVGAIAALLAFFLFHPAVLGGLQWVIDVVRP